MTTPDIDAAREALAAAEAEVDRLRAKLRAELADHDARGDSAEDQPRRLGWADGVAEARRRYGKGGAQSTAQANVAALSSRRGTSAADGVTEAPRRWSGAAS